MVQQQQRSLVGPMQIVQQEEHGCVSSSARDQISNGPKQDSARLLGWQLQRWRNIGKQPPELRQQPGHFRRIVAKRLAKGGHIPRLRQPFFQDFNDRIEWHRILAIVTTANERAHSPSRCLRADFGCNSSLADSCGAADEYYPAFAGERLLETAGESGMLRFSSNKGGSFRESAQEAGLSRREKWYCGRHRARRLGTSYRKLPSHLDSGIGRV